MALVDDDDSTYNKIDDLGDDEITSQLHHDYEVQPELPSSLDANSKHDICSEDNLPLSMGDIEANDDSLPESNMATNNSNNEENIYDIETLVLPETIVATSSSNKSNAAKNKGDRNKTINNNEEEIRKASLSSSASSTARSLKSRSSCCKQFEALVPTAPNNQQSQPLPPTPNSFIGANTNQTSSADSIVTQTTMASLSNLRQPYADKIAEGKSALENNDFLNAILVFTSCIDMNSRDYQLYGFRSKAYFKSGQYDLSLNDANRARDLNPKWTEAYYRQAIARFYLDMHEGSLATFAFGLSQDPKNERMLTGLVKTALKSKFGSRLEIEYNQLVSRDLHEKPFFVMSIIGHELLNCHYHKQAIVVMESALKIGSTQPKMIAPIISALSSAHWSVNHYNKAIEYMKKDLRLQEQMNDSYGQCRVYGNLGFAYFILRKFKESLKVHRRQLEIAMAIKNVQQAIVALNALGHIHVALNDLNSALLSHTRCLQLLKQIGNNDNAVSRELACIGHIYTLMEEYDKAREHHTEYFRLTNDKRHEECQTNLVMFNFNMAFLAIKKQNYDEARTTYEQVIRQAQRLGGTPGKLYEMRACGGLGHTLRLTNRFSEARKLFERQLDLATNTENRSGKSQALCNLGMIAQQTNDYELASKFFRENEELVGEHTLDKNTIQEDPYLIAYAYCYMGSVFFSTKQYDESRRYYKKSLNAFEQFDGSLTEAAAIHNNISQAYEKSGAFNKAFTYCERSKNLFR